MGEEQMNRIRINKFQNIDVNNPEFYEDIQCEIVSDLARLKKSVEVMKSMRLAAAELEVETAARYHAEVWYELLDTKNISEDNSEDEGSNRQDSEENQKVDASKRV